MIQTRPAALQLLENLRSTGFQNFPLLRHGLAGAARSSWGQAAPWKVGFEQLENELFKGNALSYILILFVGVTIKYYKI